MARPGACLASQLLVHFLPGTPVMADQIGGVTLVKFVEVSTDGSAYSLYGWPRPSTSSRIESKFGTILKSAGWRPFKLVKICSQSSTNPRLPKIRHVVKGPLKYCDKFGWHYRYLQMFEVPGQPPLSLPQLNKSPCTSLQPPVGPSSPYSSLVNCPAINSDSELRP